MDKNIVQKLFHSLGNIVRKGYCVWRVADTGILTTLLQGYSKLIKCHTEKNDFVRAVMVALPCAKKRSKELVQLGTRVAGEENYVS